MRRKRRKSVQCDREPLATIVGDYMHGSRAVNRASKEFFESAQPPQAVAQRPLVATSSKPLQVAPSFAQVPLAMPSVQAFSKVV